MRSIPTAAGTVTERSPDRAGSNRGRVSTAVVVFALAAACTAEPDEPHSAEPAAPAAKETAPVLLAATDAGDVSLDGASGALLAGGPGTVATPDGATMYRATRVQGHTVVSALDPRTGATTGSTHLRGRLELAIASVSGRALALVQPAPGAPEGSLPGLPVPRQHTPIVVTDPEGGGDHDRFVLDGNYEPEAFSIEDDRLFMIQYLPAEAPAVYRVTVLDLESGKVRPVTGRFKSPPERMPGVRLGQVYDPVTSQMYTLYSNQPGAYADGYEHAGGSSHEWPEETFVHVLNLRKGWAYCAGVPKAMWGGTAREQTLAPSPDGGSLYIVDARMGMVAVMDTRSLEVVRTAQLQLGGPEPEPEAETERTSAAVSLDGSTLFVTTGTAPGSIWAIGTDDFSVAERWASPVPASSLGLSLDGSALYVAGAGRIASIDLRTGRAGATMPTPVLEPIVDLDPLPAAGDGLAG